MWILPAFVAPPGTLALEHAVGWRWALLAPVPMVLAGRVLVAGAAGAGPDEPAPGRALGPDPAGAGRGGRPLLPTARAGARRPRRGRGAGRRRPAAARRHGPGPAAARRPRWRRCCCSATGWFGADGLVTVLFTDGYGTSVARAAVVLSAAPLAWAVTSLAVPRKVPPALGAGARRGRRRGGGGVGRRTRSGWSPGQWPAPASGWRTRASTCVARRPPGLPRRTGDRGDHRGGVRRAARRGRGRRRSPAAGLPRTRAGARLRRLRRRAHRRGARRPPGPAGGVARRW